MDERTAPAQELGDSELFHQEEQPRLERWMLRQQLMHHLQARHRWCVLEKAYLGFSNKSVLGCGATAAA